MPDERSNQLPTIPNALAPPGEEALKTTEEYTILNVEKFQSSLNHYSGLRVILSCPSVPVIAIPLWLTNTDVSRTSKLGAFISAFGNETEKWLGKKFRIVAWTNKNRQIAEVIKPA